MHEHDVSTVICKHHTKGQYVTAEKSSIVNWDAEIVQFVIALVLSRPFISILRKISRYETVLLVLVVSLISISVGYMRISAEIWVIQ